jgi:hypothetical protein
MISFLWHLHFRNKSIYLKVIDVVVYPIDLLLILLDNTFYRFFLALYNLDSHGFKVTWTIDFIIDFTKVFFFADHRSKTLFVNGVAAVESFHHFVPTCPAFEALLLGKDLVADYT